MDNDLQAIVNFYERDRGVNRELIIRAIESALEQVFGKEYRCVGCIRVEIDRKKLSVKAFRRYVASDTELGAAYLPLEKARKARPDIVTGMSFEVEIPASSLGRIGIQNARQQILNKLREAERTFVIDNYRSKVGEIITGTVRSVSRRGDITLTIENAEAIMQRRDCLPTDRFTEGDTVRAIIVKVLPLAESVQSSAPPVILSRASSSFLRQLFVTEVSEINDGTVEIMGVARDPGSRSKISVRSFDPNVDPVGACVGVRGVRVRTIVSELGGEKIDIVRWKEDPCQYAIEALSPAKLLSVTVDPNDPRKISAIVSDDQLSLAIGRNGQNVRLATKLVGCSINITKRDSELSFEAKLERAAAELVSGGIDSEDAKLLAQSGFTSLDGIVEEGAEAVADATGLDYATASTIVAKAIAATEGASR